MSIKENLWALHHLLNTHETNPIIVEKKMQLLEALADFENDLNPKKILELLWDNSNFAREGGEDIRRNAERIMKKLEYSTQIKDFCLQYLYTHQQEHEARTKTICSFIFAGLNTTLDGQKYFSSLKELLKALFPSVLEEYLTRVPYDFQLNKEQEPIIEKFFNTFLEKQKKAYPNASNQLKHIFKSKKYHILWKQKFQKYIHTTFSKHFEKIIANQEDSTELLATFVILQEDIYADITSRYLQFMLAEVEQEFQLSHQRKTRKNTTKNSQFSPHTEKENLIKEDEKNNEISEYTEIIRNTIQNFELPEKDKRQLNDRLLRLYKNQKPFKKSDYFGENALFPIQPQDEGSLLDLVEELQLSITQENTSQEDAITATQTETLENITTLFIQQAKEKLQEPTLPNINDIQAVITYAIEQFQFAKYWFKNTKTFIKKLEEFCKNPLHAKALVNLCSNPIKLQDIDKKPWSNIYSLSIGGGKGGQSRIVLLKQEDRFTIYDFYANHDDYEIAIAQLR